MPKDTADERPVGRPTKATIANAIPTYKSNVTSPTSWTPIAYEKPAESVISAFKEHRGTSTASKSIAWNAARALCQSLGDDACGFTVVRSDQLKKTGEAE